MASIRLNLEDGIWQEITNKSFVGQKKSAMTSVEMCTASSLPIGDVVGSFVINDDEMVKYNADLNGLMWYVRAIYNSAKFTYLEVE